MSSKISICLSHLHILMDGKTKRAFGISDRCTNKWPQWHIASEHQLWEKYPKKAIFKKRLKKSEKIMWLTCYYLFVDICLYSGTNYKSSHISMRSWWCIFVRWLVCITFWSNTNKYVQTNQNLVNCKIRCPLIMSPLIIY